MPAIRFKALLDGFGTASFFNTICSSNYGPPLKKLGTLITTQLGGACLQALADTKPGTPGLQASCQVAEMVGPAYKPVPACQTSSGPCNPCPCWRVVPDPKCAALSGYTAGGGAQHAGRLGDPRPGPRAWDPSRPAGSWLLLLEPRRLFVHVVWCDPFPRGLV